MSDLRMETWTMPAADLGPANPLPSLRSKRELHALDEGSNVPQPMVESLIWGHPASILPYTIQDGYQRQRQPREFRVAVLENEILRATFLLELGGRLWSLFHKPSGRELLSVNPVFQPANLAIRNAWFSGGVEWNIGIIGHCPFTCEPLFAARVDGPDGTPVLRMYEWERVRQTPFQIDAYLPDGSPLLFVRIRIVNPHDHDTPMYWWSNMAVPETPATRVIAPASDALQFGYGRLDIVTLPQTGGVDASYPAHLKDACDFFFRIPDGQRRWITALDGAGRGLAQVSTDLLRGRKLFVWGMNPGGRRWQEFLSVPGQAYLEIQAGLPRTQMEYLRMPAQAEWAWLEAYGLMEANPDAAHSADWTTAQSEIEGKLETLIPRQRLDAELSRGERMAERSPTELLQRGSGWGALERLRREKSGEAPFCSDGLLFDAASLTAEQAPWLALLRDGALPAADPDVAPGGCMVQPEWRERLEAALTADRGNHWLSWLHLGVMRYHAGDHTGAAEAWQRSLQATRTPWALRNLAALAWAEKDWPETSQLYSAALRLKPDLLPLAVECGAALLDAGQPTAWLEIMPLLPETLRSNGRIRLLQASAALALGDLATVEQILAERPVVEDLREGDNALTEIWFEYHLQRLSAAENLPPDTTLASRVRREHPLPAEMDFRMRE